ncbi:MAG: TetR/AcrR family transcriptional regulator [Candidatus Saccharimonadales bacterium]
MESTPSVTRSRILAHARSKLKEGEFQRATVRGICAELDISRVTFYCHFRSKQHLMDGLILTVQEEAVALMTGCEYKEAIARLVDFIDENRMIFRNLLINRKTTLDALVFSRTLAAIILRMYKRQEKEGRKFAFNKDLAAVYVAGGIIYILAYWVNDGTQMTREEVENCLLTELNGGVPLFAVAT